MLQQPGPLNCYWLLITRLCRLVLDMLLLHLLIYDSLRQIRWHGLLLLLLLLLLLKLPLLMVLSHCLLLHFQLLQRLTRFYTSITLLPIEQPSQQHVKSAAQNFKKQS